MPKIQLNLPHTLGAEEAKRRVNHLIAETRVKFSNVISDVQESWTGNVDTFQFRAMGFAVTGTIDAQPAVVLIQMQIPLAALPFKGRIEAELSKHAKELLA
jgi:hypothetical protein